MRLNPAVLLLAALTAIACGDKADASPEEDPRVRQADLARIMGDSAAPTWLVMVSDFQCPWCKRWHDDTWPQVERDYVATGKARIAYLHFPITSIHPHAMPAAEASMCAGAQGKFWAFHDSLFATQGDWASMTDATPVFDRIAGGVGLDLATYRQCLDDDVMLPLIAADQQRARASGAQSTPTFFAGSKIILGAQPFDSIKVALDAALAGATSTPR